MAKETFYFTHDYNARNDDKILELRSVHGAEGYGIFWMIVETMAENSNGGVKVTLIGGLSLGYGVAKDRLMAIFECCLEIGLFYEKEGFYFSKRMLTHKELRTKLSESGKAGAEKRWGGYGLPNGKGKERKKKESININTNSDFVCNNAEYYILNNQKVFEKICIATSKNIDIAIKELHAYHLWMTKNQNYPTTEAVVEAGFETWLLNDFNKNYNGTQQTGQPKIKLK